MDALPFKCNVNRQIPNSVFDYPRITFVKQTMTGFPIVILAGFSIEVKNLTAHSRLFLRKSIKLASY